MRRRRALTSLALVAVVSALVAVPGTAAGSGQPPDPVVDYALDVDSTPVVIDVLANDTDVEGDRLSLVARSGPAQQGGTFSCDAVACTYTPPSPLPQAEFDHFAYLVSDGTSVTRGTAIAIFVPHNPVAEGDTLFVTGGGPVPVDVLANDHQPQGLPVEVVPSSETLSSGGTAECTSTGCEYTPPSSAPRSDVFTYTITDGLRTGEGHVTLYDGRPQVGDDDVAYFGGPTLDIDVLSNDTSPEGHPMAVVAQAATPTAEGGTVDCDTSACTYTPPDPMPGIDSFVYQATDGDLSAQGLVTIENLVCADPTGALDDNGLITGYAWEACTGLTSNGAETDFTPLMPSVGPTSLVMTNGTVDAAEAPNDEPDVIGVPGRHNTYRDANDVQVLRLDLDIPAGTTCMGFDYVFGSDEFPEYVGSEFEDAFVAELDSHTWSATDFEVSAPDTFAVDGLGAPVSVNSAFFDPGQVVEVTGTEYDGSTPRETAVTAVTPGSHSLYLSVFDAGDWVVDSGVVIDNLRVGSDPSGGCPGGVDPDIAVNDAAETDEDDPISIGVLANDVLAAGSTPTVVAGAPPALGTVACSTAGLCTYTPDADANGTDHFTYTVQDGLGGVDSATVTVTIRPINDDPVAVDDTLGTRSDAPGVVDVLENDSDVDGDVLEVSVSGHPTDGTVDCSTDGQCTYTPNPGASGVDDFSYTVDDGNGGTATASVAVDVGSANTAPDGTDDALVIDEDRGGVVDVLANDTDADGDSLAVESNTDGSEGVAECDAAGECTYVPNPDVNGSDSFTYTVDDANGGTDVVTVSVTVRPVDDEPVAVNDAIDTDTAVAGSVDVLANDTDVDGDVLEVGAHGQGNYGTVSCDPGGKCTYTPDPGFSGNDGFFYRVDDGAGGSAVGAVAVSVGAPPASCATDELTISLGGALSGSFAGCVSGGDAVIETDGLGARTLRGSVVVPSVGGAPGDATITFDLERLLLLNAWNGEVSIDDPTAGISGTAVSVLAPLNSWGTTVQGSLYGLTESGPPRSFSVQFTVTDLG